MRQRCCVRRCSTAAQCFQLPCALPCARFVGLLLGVALAQAAVLVDPCSPYLLLLLPWCCIQDGCSTGCRYIVSLTHLIRTAHKGCSSCCSGFLPGCCGRARVVLKFCTARRAMQACVWLPAVFVVAKCSKFRKLSATQNSGGWGVLHGAVSVDTSHVVSGNFWCVFNLVCLRGCLESFAACFWYTNRD